MLKNFVFLVDYHLVVSLQDPLNQHTRKLVSPLSERAHNQQRRVADIARHKRYAYKAIAPTETTEAEAYDKKRKSLPTHNRNIA